MADQNSQTVQQDATQPVSLSDQLTQVSQELQNQTATRLVCDKLIELANVKIVDNTPQKDGVDPIAIAISGDVVANVLKPVIDLVNSKRERLLAIKEQILQKMQEDLAAAPAPTSTSAKK